VTIAAVVVRTNKACSLIESPCRIVGFRTKRERSETLRACVACELGEPFATSPEAIAFAKSNPKLRDVVHDALDKLIANGTYATIVAKWNLQSSAVKQVTLNAAAAH
jgi:hypothetical protein